MERFDIKKFEENKKKGNTNYTIGDSIEVQEFDSSLGYIRYTRKKDELFSDYFVFHHSGSLKERGQVFILNGLKGLFRKYDEKGNLIKEIDYDKPYKFTLDQVIEYLKNHESNLNNISRYHDDATGVGREIDEKTKKHVWLLNFKGKYNNIEGIYIITLDGETGEEVLVKRLIGKMSGTKGTGTYGKYEVLYDRLEMQKKQSFSIYKTHQGKNYTKAEWEEYERDQYKNYKKEN